MRIQNRLKSRRYSNQLIPFNSHRQLTQSVSVGCSWPVAYSYARILNVIMASEDEDSTDSVYDSNQNRLGLSWCIFSYRQEMDFLPKVSRLKNKSPGKMCEGSWRGNGRLRYVLNRASEFLMIINLCTNIVTWDKRSLGYNLRLYYMGILPTQ